MKKNIFISTCLILFGTAVSSCNKKYTCVENGQPTEIFFSKDYTPSQMLTLDSVCVQNGGYWEVYNN